jgi:hypothetical protein
MSPIVHRPSHSQTAGSAVYSSDPGISSSAAVKCSVAFLAECSPAGYPRFAVGIITVII